MIILTRDELKDITGYVKPALQCRWLAQHGYYFDVRADGHPTVSRAHYESKHQGGKGKRVGLNLQALDR